jgi:uncharacterized repeat protein (TIGR02543 family)
MKKHVFFTAMFSMVIIFGVFGKDFKVSFDAKGGEPAPAAQTIKKGKKATEPQSAPAKANHIFNGWYTDDAYTTKWKFDRDTVTADTSLYAKWRPVVSGTGPNVPSPIPVKQPLTKKTLDSLRLRGDELLFNIQFFISEEITLTMSLPQTPIASVDEEGILHIKEHFLDGKRRITSETPGKLVYIDPTDNRLGISFESDGGRKKVLYFLPANEVLPRQRGDEYMLNPDIKSNPPQVKYDEYLYDVVVTTPKKWPYLLARIISEEPLRDGVEGVLEKTLPGHSVKKAK